MRRRLELSKKMSIRRAVAGAVALLCLLAPLPAYSALLPDGFFDRVPASTNEQAAIAADYLTQDAAGIVTASGQVDMSYQGYFATADRLVFNQRTKEVLLVGNVAIRDPDGTEYSADRIEVTGNFRKALLHTMVMITPDGAMITADQTDHDMDGKTILERGTYAPCGTCIDANGNRIGWRVRTSRMIYDQENELIDLEQPVLELLGIPMAWLPWIRLPDPSNPRASGFRLPSYAYSEKIGLKLVFPYFHAVGKDTDVTVVPALMSRQGLLLSTSVTQRFGNWGTASATASGVYQLDRSAFAGTVGDRDWRGALQTSGKFTPADDWTVGWSYTTFTDPAFLTDYLLPTSSPAVNEVYAEYLTPDTFAEARIQEFKILGNVTQADQDKQASALPNARAEHIFDLGDDNGRLSVSGRLLGVNRVADSTTTANGVPYVLGYAENKIHGTVEAGWTKQWETPAGVLLTPYVGMRADAAYYDGSSALLPGSSQLFNATPIAALDVRYPMIAVAKGSTHIIEPIGQMVYRGSDVTAVGITNDNAQSFIFDDSNLFSFNRFSGTDRQETGLRANIGGHYLASFSDGSYIDFIAGQSFHLAGTNALGVSDTAQTGTSTGLGTPSSDIVLAARASMMPGVSAGAKVIVDPADASIERTALAASFANGGWSVAADYSYLAADPAVGLLTDQQDVGGSLRVPLHEYWYATAAAGWNITANAMIDHSASIGYDDGYLAVAGHYSASGADPFNPAAKTYKLSFKLKGPDGSGYGF